MSALSTPASSASIFSDSERNAIVQYWNAPGRYTVSFNGVSPGHGPARVCLTTAGSIWLHRYQALLGGASLPPGSDPSAASQRDAAWESWLQSRIAFDRERAQLAVNATNRTAGVNSDDPPPLPDPGPPPQDLLAAAGPVPSFAEAVSPLHYHVVFDDGEAFDYEDHVPQRPRSPYYRSDTGTVFYGGGVRSLPAAEVTDIFSRAGLTPSEARVALAVSKLEGGFESVNTYDTGFVSVGFIQFITGVDGSGSLSAVLDREKTDDPAAFAADFHGFGVDVADGILTVVDLSTTAELAGAAAVQKVIQDKRLTAVFQRAGRHSSAFRAAQVRIAKSHYWPADDPIQITLNGVTSTVRVGDVIHSEAGLATLFDRKVNRGTIGPLPAEVNRVIAEHHLASLTDLAAYEREIISAVRYRTDFLSDPSLSQPP